jgi:dipeptidyl aminopeptidase/acylaminoacyl peptidase
MSESEAAGRLARRLPLATVPFLIALVCLLPLACAKHATRPESPGQTCCLDPPVGDQGMADDSPAWSPDGSSIAFHRAIASNYGPAGVYIISLGTLAVRLVTPGNFFSPRDLSFSPDGTRLVGVSATQLAIIDVTTGDTTRPLYTESGVWCPNWSPDGTKILYHRGPTQWDYPPDSSGIHILDLTTGEDRAVWAGSRRLGGWPVRWSPDGHRIAFVDDPPGDYVGAISVYTLGDTVVQTFMGTTDTRYPSLRWYVRPRSHTNALLFSETNGHWLQTHLIDSQTGRPLPWLMCLGPQDVPSPDGEWLALIRAQPSDSVGVLYMRGVWDFRGTSRRQLTQYLPP